MKNIFNGGRAERKTGGSLALVPMVLFTLVFVIGPLVYMIILSFMRRRGSWGIEAVFSLQNYRRIFEPVYLETFRQSIKLAVISTLIVVF
ncbi:MAG: hypothetical protein LBG91_02575, partial [Treponema sp.]|nr:hypothetical protein [Treponema sp.]